MHTQTGHESFVVALQLLEGKFYNAITLAVALAGLAVALIQLYKSPRAPRYRPAHRLQSPGVFTLPRLRAVAVNAAAITTLALPALILPPILGVRQPQP